ncbi:hypothetical protein EDB81DRAFT_882215 [Dactylonectria macrodidyma]|uniref:Uncharacterized protein n=1 Tax=Dactylonectria macrodidyma TaxID=307937 RepID=A0A9P9F5E6_9HYPO|nr:hypothetical protein EDB81DRAFT_882215 [Dactylonectria macrodidyma]
MPRDDRPRRNNRRVPYERPRDDPRSNAQRTLNDRVTELENTLSTSVAATVTAAATMAFARHDEQTQVAERRLRHELNKRQQHAFGIWAENDWGNLQSDGHHPVTQAAVGCDFAGATSEFWGMPWSHRRWKIFDLITLFLCVGFSGIETPAQFCIQFVRLSEMLALNAGGRRFLRRSLSKMRRNDDMKRSYHTVPYGRRPKACRNDSCAAMGDDNVAQPNPGGSLAARQNHSEDVALVLYTAQEANTNAVIAKVHSCPWATPSSARRDGRKKSREEQAKTHKADSGLWAPKGTLWACLICLNK